MIPTAMEAKPVRNWPRIALWLVVTTLVYNIIEAGIALWSGASAGSIALEGFGMDSLVETSAAVLLLWRLRVEAQGSDRETIERAERLVYRFVGFTFMLLVIYILAQSGWMLYQKNHPEESLVGIILACCSLTIMPIVAWGKLRAAREIGSAALRAEAKETLACSLLSLALLLGLLGNELMGWWWADPLAALAMVPWLIKEGLEGLRGECACG